MQRSIYMNDHYIPGLISFKLLLSLGEKNSSALTSAMVTDDNPNNADDDAPTPIMDTSSIIGLFIWFACVLYSSIRTSSNSQARRYYNL